MTTVDHKEVMSRINTTIKVCRTGRNSGILMHITSLPSPYGIGTMGAEALEFIDFLVLSGTVLLANFAFGRDRDSETLLIRAFRHEGRQSCTFIDLDELVRKGLLPEDTPKQFDFGDDPERVDYGRLWENRRAALSSHGRLFKRSRGNR
jgi:4-alpha-glucanotransferase